MYWAESSTSKCELCRAYGEPLKKESIIVDFVLRCASLLRACVLDFSTPHKHDSHYMWYYHNFSSNFIHVNLAKFIKHSLDIYVNFFANYDHIIQIHLKI